MCLLPADGLADFEGGASAVGLVPGGVRAIQQHAVLHVDEAGEGHVPQEVVAPAGLFEQAEKHAVRLVHLAALHQGQPVVEAFLEGAVKAQRFLVCPVRGGPGHDGARFGLVGPAPVMPRRLAQELVPGVEAGGHVPDGLRHGQVAQLAGQVVRQRQAGAAAQQAVVVVDEPQRNRRRCAGGTARGCTGRGCGWSRERFRPTGARREPGRNRPCWRLPGRGRERFPPAGRTGRRPAVLPTGDS